MCILTSVQQSYAYSWSEPVVESPAGDMCGAGDLVVDITGRSCDILPELSTLTPSGAESLVLHRAPDNALVLVVEQTNAAQTVCSVGAVKLKQTRSPANNTDQDKEGGEEWRWTRRELRSEIVSTESATATLRRRNAMQK